MKKIAYLLWVAALCSPLAMTGCDSSETKVIEAPAVEEEDPAMGEMSEEDYNKAMEESMK